MSDPLRVMTSHFSGVVTIICVSSISRFVSCMSPVSSRTFRPVQIIDNQLLLACQSDTPTRVPLILLVGRLHVWMQLLCTGCASCCAPSGASRLAKAAVTSAARAFMGATYTTLKLFVCSRMSADSQHNEQLVHHLLLGAEHAAKLAICSARAQRAAGTGWLAWMIPSLMLAAISCSTVSIAMLVLPAPVGAHTRMFSLLLNAFSKMVLWMRFSALQETHSVRLYASERINQLNRMVHALFCVCIAGQAASCIQLARC
jgi:hypothetical protein